MSWFQGAGTHDDATGCGYGFPIVANFGHNSRKPEIVAQKQLFFAFVAKMLQVGEAPDNPVRCIGGIFVRLTDAVDPDGIEAIPRSPGDVPAVR